MPYKNLALKRKTQQEYYQRNREKILDRAARDYQNNREERLKYAENYRRENTERYLYSSAKTRASKANLPFTITEDDIIIPSTCPILGIPIKQSNIGQRETSPSLDRIVNDKGYVKGNIHVISYRANRIKNDATLEELELMVKYLRRRIDNLSLTSL